ncbi:DUF1254 domain-containing protein [Taibaiella soli]|uniref:DUF1254 domain-containing protein n=1 Tax=Taibaiella soli TaxID=1649169 RepID=A0A2W2AFB0_9BACT|nr:DUF1254 domain-containing protein [Taibaiella soli]PZF70860.1 hypothetical protein DN068_20755 [Taibaiella soli]
MKRIVSILIAASLLTACGQNNGSKNTTSAESPATNDSTVLKTVRDAYVFALPLVLMDISRRQLTDGAGKFKVPENKFYHMSQFPDANFRDVVRPNGDTYYSSAWLNLAKEPLVLTVPNTNGRYYMLPMLDAYTNVFASPGKRTTGTDAGNFLVTGPLWTGTVPEGMKQIKAPTDMVWIIGRTQVNSKEDGEKIVQPIQKQFQLTPLSAWGKPYTAPAPVTDPALPKGSPNEVAEQMPVDQMLNYANDLMVTNPPAEADKAAMDQFATIGFGPGKKFDLAKLPAGITDAVKGIPAATFKTINDKLGDAKAGTGWSPVMKTGIYGTDYMQRAFIAVLGLGANLPQDAIYPSCSFDADGNKLDGANNYVIHFDKGKTPPANAFWSLTMYDPAGYMTANPINRFTIGDRSGLKPNADGSVDIYIQHSNPGKEKESNWLPAPEGNFNVMMRVYWPKDEMINGSWTPQAVKKA